MTYGSVQGAMALPMHSGIEGKHNMGIAYTVEGTARAASVTEHAVNVAINAGDLPIRQVGESTIILATDIQSWLEGITPI